jgi:drug/metabolite transporter (DMT)-like permease
MIIPILGALAALFAAFLWASASLLFAQAGRWLPPLHLNLFKGVCGLALLGLTLLVLPGNSSAYTPAALLWLGLSGLIGISVGDTAYLSALNELGPRRTLLLSILAPPMTALLSLILLHEALTLWAWGGIAITTAGVAWVISERTSEDREHHPVRWRGITWGLVAALAQSGAVILSRAVFLTTTVNALQSAVIRLAAGVIGLLLWMTLTGQIRLDLSTLHLQPRLFGYAFAATFLGTYLAMWLQQVALTYAAAGIVQTLLATSPIFVLPLAAWRGERLTPRAILGAVVSLLGVWLLFQPI